MNYILFAKKECPFCIKAEDLLKTHDLNYSMVNFQEDQSDILQEIKNAYDWGTVPMIFARDADSIKFVGGFTDLVRFLENER